MKSISESDLKIVQEVADWHRGKRPFIAISRENDEAGNYEKLTQFLGTEVEEGFKIVAINGTNKYLQTQEFSKSSFKTFIRNYESNQLNVHAFNTAPRAPEGGGPIRTSRITPRFCDSKEI